MMKKSIGLIGSLLVLILTSCIQDDIIELDASSTTILISKEKDAVIDPGGSLRVRASYIEANREFKEAVFEWTSENPSIATINPQGVVTAMSKGTTNVYAQAYGFSSKRENIQVVEDTSAAYKVTIQSPKSAVLLSETISLTVEAQNINNNPAILRTVSWKSLTPEIATINETTGEITPLATGNAIFQATVDGVLSNLLTISVGNDSNAIASIDISGNGNTMMTNETKELQAVIKNFNGDILTGTVTWTSSNPSIATVDPQGVVRSISEGEVVITASYSGVTSTYAIEVMDLNSQLRTGTLSTLTYSTNGTFSLELTPDNELKLNFINFDQPDALRLPGVIVYLANSDNAGNAKTNGLRIGRVPQVSGNFTMNVPSNDPVGDYTKFSRVLIMCEPFTISMGSGPFDN